MVEAIDSSSSPCGKPISDAADDTAAVIGDPTAFTL